MSTIIPPSFHFDGDKKAASSKKGIAYQFASLVINQMKAGGIDNIQRRTILADGTVIVVNAIRNKIYNLIHPQIYVYYSPTVIISEIGESLEYITVMSQLVDPSGYSYSTPPFQVSNARDYYGSLTSKITSEKAFAGGTRTHEFGGYTGLTTQNHPGGYWTNRKGLSISWTKNTLFINGKFYRVNYSGFNSTYHYIINALIVPPNDEINEYQIITFIIDNRYDSVSLRRFSVFNIDDVSTSNLSCSYTPLPSDTSITYPGLSSSTFTTDTYSLLCVKTSSVSGGRTNQELIVRKYNASFTAFSDTTIESGLLEQIRSASDSVFKEEGTTPICRVQPEGNSFGLVLCKMKDGVGSYNYNGEHPPSSFESYSITYTYQLAMINELNEYTVVTPSIDTFIYSSECSSSGEIWSLPENPLVTDVAVTTTEHKVYDGCAIIGYSVAANTLVYIKTKFISDYNLSPDFWYDLTAILHNESFSSSADASLNKNGNVLIDFNGSTTSIINTTLNPSGSHYSGIGQNQLNALYIYRAIEHSTAFTENLLISCYHKEGAITSNLFLPNFTIMVDLQKGDYTYLDYSIDYHYPTSTPLTLSVASKPIVLR